MRKVFAILLAINALFLGALLLQRSPFAHGGAAASRNGDVNGDGKLDIADGVYLIYYQFRGGPAPVPFECPPSAAQLPATGQTTCYKASTDRPGWAAVPCGEATCPGQDGAALAGCPMQGRFVDNGDGTVTDNCTGLMWQKNTADTNGDGLVVDNGAETEDNVAWCDALSFCDNLSLAGRDDWRLPNAQELRSIVDFGRFNPALDPAFGATTASYWTSTTYTGHANDRTAPEFAWIVLCQDGTSSFAEKAITSFYVRAVRNAR